MGYLSAFIGGAAFGVLITALFMWWAFNKAMYEE